MSNQLVESFVSFLPPLLNDQSCSYKAEQLAIDCSILSRSCALPTDNYLNLVSSLENSRQLEEFASVKNLHINNHFSNNGFLLHEQMANNNGAQLLSDLHNFAPSTANYEHPDDNAAINSFNLDQHLDLTRFIFLNQKAPTKEENERALLVDCTSVLSPGSASSLSSSSSSEPPPPPSAVTLTNTHPTVKSNVKRLLKREKSTAKATNDCLSSDEGYAGSYSESYLSEFRKNSRTLLKCAEVQEEARAINLSIFAEPIEDVPKTLLDEAALREQHSLFESVDDSITLAELSRIGEETALERTVNERAAEEEMRIGDWRSCLQRRSVEEKSRLDRRREDELDLGVYLQEIDMNVTYFQSDPADPTEPSLLKFASAENAFNLRLHHRLIHQRHAFRALFADVDAIPEFVPAPLHDLEEDEYETTYVEEAYEVELVEGECAYPEQEYTMVEADEGFREAEALYVNDELDSYDQDLDEFEDQLLIDSLSEEEKLALLQSESEKYALQMAQASKYGILNAASTGKEGGRKSRRYNSGASSSAPSETPADMFDGVFGYEEFDESSSTSISLSDAAKLGSSSSSSSLRTSLLKLMQTRRHLAEMIEKNASTCSSQASSLTTASSLNKQMASRKPCVYMLNEGRCMRADCRFAHDLKTITCKYWLDGDCLKGDNCEFLHGVVEAKPTKSFKKKYDKIYKKDFKLDTEEFPELGGASNKNASKSGTKSAKNSNKTAATMLFANVATNKPLKTAAKTPAVNIVANSKQSNKAKKNAHKTNNGTTSPALAVTKSAKSTITPTPTTIINTGRKSRDPQAKSSQPKVSNKANNSCGSSCSSSSTCSSSSRCNSIVRNGKK